MQRGWTRLKRWHGSRYVMSRYSILRYTLVSTVLFLEDVAAFSRAAGTLGRTCQYRSSGRRQPSPGHLSRRREQWWRDFNDPTLKRTYRAGAHNQQQPGGRHDQGKTGTALIQAYRYQLTLLSQPMPPAALIGILIAAGIPNPAASLPRQAMNWTFWETGQRP